MFAGRIVKIALICCLLIFFLNVFFFSFLFIPTPGSAILALLLAGYLAQQYLPMPTPKVLGIDLGTTYCSVGVFHPGTGDVKVIMDDDGHQSIPSIVSFTEKDIYVGYEGLELADANPQNTIYDAKRFIGKIFSPEELEKESDRYQFKVRDCTLPFIENV